MLNEKKGDLAAGLVDQQLSTQPYYEQILQLHYLVADIPLAIIGVGWRFEQRPCEAKRTVVVGWAYNEMGTCNLRLNIKSSSTRKPCGTITRSPILTTSTFGLTHPQTGPRQRTLRLSSGLDDPEETENYLDLLREAGMEMFTR